MVFDQILGVFWGENVAFFFRQDFRFFKIRKKTCIFRLPPFKFHHKIPRNLGSKGYPLKISKKTPKKIPKNVNFLQIFVIFFDSNPFLKTIFFLKFTIKFS